MTQLSLAKDSLKVLLLEGVHESAIREFNDLGFTNLEHLKSAMDEDQLIEKIKDVHILGIRSRTKVTEKVLDAAENLMTIGCFCIGANQVALGAANKRGIPVFNAPHSNTRSVAELVLGEIVMMLRRIPEKSAGCHNGKWDKSANDSFELRGKTLGIVGYGHIGSQLSVLAEAMGMQVRYFDIAKKLAIGNARPMASLEELLSTSNVVSLHVPATALTANLIGEAEIRTMKRGSCLINASRGNVVVIDALSKALRDRHLFGAAIDVFPEEPTANGEEFHSPLRGMPNVILTPHIGGSTLEAQENIGTEVAEKLTRYASNGSTVGAVNFVEVSLPIKSGDTRFLHIHKNIPGMLHRVNEIFSSRSINIAAQYLQTNADVGYVVVDVDGEIDARTLLAELTALQGTIRARVLV